MKKGIKENKGITLIALVITIIVLLILAGVSISMLAGDNGILKQAARAKEQTERAKAEEVAQLAYIAAIMEDEDVTEDTLMGKVVEELEKQGYNVNEVSTETTTITGMNLEPSTDPVVLETEGEATTVNITLTTDSESSSKKYVEINGKYYEITIDSEGVKIADEPADITPSESEPRTDMVEASIEPTDIADVTVTGSTSTSYTLTITPKEKSGSAEITLTVDETEIIKKLGVKVEEAVISWTQTEEGKITNGKGITLEIGDKITYDPHSGDGANLTYSSPKDSNGYDVQEFSTESATTEWGVLGFEDGQILIMPMKSIKRKDGQKFYMGNKSSIDYAQKAYVNGASEIENISQIYGHGKGATKARAIKVEDINKITGYNPNNIGVRDPDQKGTGTPYREGNIDQYGNKVKYYWDGTNYPYCESVAKDGSVTASESMPRDHDYFVWYDGSAWHKVAKDSSATATNKKEIKDGETVAQLTSNYYWYWPGELKDSNGNKIGLEEDDKAYTMLEKGAGAAGSETYWLGSTYVHPDWNFLHFRIVYFR